jgi:hypothetical protein
VLPGFSENLGLFSAAPTEEPRYAGGKLGQFVAMAPERIYDSRKGVGGRTTRIGAGETVKVKIAGAGSIPVTDVSAVAVNITSIKPSGNTWLAAFPTGYPKPDSSTLNPRVGAIVPNMSIVGLGTDGTFSLYNNAADVHVTVDVMGYFRTSAAAKMMPLSPSRVLDTRTGVGVRKGPLNGGQPVALQVLGKGGVPASGVDAVIINLGSMRATTDGWITAWPTGVARPTVANLTYRAGQVVPNLMMCKVGPDGKINIEASSGQVHLIGDVVGCFTSTGSQLSPIAPSRLLDTRKGVGAPLARIGAGKSLNLKVTGVGSVPTSATAVALNVSAVRPTVQTFLTIFPTGEKMPVASSLNPDPGAVSANLVVAKVGKGGQVTIYNDKGNVDLLADVTAFYL